jgi:hypothetical protein
MAAAYSVFTKIVGEDGLSEVFRKVGTAARTAFAPVHAFNKAVESPTSNALGRVGAAADGVAGRFRAGLGSISAWLPALGALGSALTLGGLIAMTRSASEGFEGLTIASEKLGVSTKQLAQWRYGARQVNVDAEQLEKGLVKLKKAMFDAATGKNKDVAALFAAMKIPLRDAQGHVKNLDTSLDDIAEAFKNTTDEETKNAAALALFGRAGADLIPFLNRGRAGMAEWRAEQARYSGLNKKGMADLEALAKSYKHLDAAGSGLSKRLSAAMAPALIKVVDWTTNWIAVNRDLIGQSIERKIAKISTAFEFLAGAGQKVLAVPWVGELMKGADAGTAFDVALGFLGLTMTGPLFAAIQMIGKAWGRMTLTLLTSPVGAGLALLALQVWSLSQHWDEKMTAIREASERGFGAKALQIFKEFNGLTIIAESVNDGVKALTGIDLAKIFKAILSKAWEEVKSWLPNFEGAWDKLKPVMNWVDRNTGPVPQTAAAQRTADSYRDAFADKGSGVPPASPYLAGYNLPQPPSPGSPGALGPGLAVPQKVEATVKVDFTNVPRGADVSVSGSSGVKIERNVGYSKQDNT